MPKVRYISRSLIDGPYVGLCLDEEGDNTVFLICVKRNPKFSRIESYATLVHEAIHVWQKWSRSIGAEGDYEPGDEFEAYAIQSISQRLMEAFEGK